MSTGVFVATIRTARKTSASSFLKKKIIFWGPIPVLPSAHSCVELGCWPLLPVHPPPFGISASHPKNTISLVTGTSCHSLQPGSFPNLTALQLPTGEITMAAMAEVVFGKCFSRFLFPRVHNYQDLLKASNFPQKTLKSTKVVIPYLDR